MSTLQLLSPLFALLVLSTVCAETSLPQPALNLTAEEQEWLAAHPKIVLGTTDQFKPEVIITTDGQQTGLIADYFKLLNQQLGGPYLQLHVERDWETVGAKAIQHEIDGLAISTPNPKWDQHFLYCIPYYYGYFYVYARTDQTLQVTHLADLAGKRVGYLRGIKKIEQLLQTIPQVQAIPLESNESIAEALAKSRVDAVLARSDLEWWRRRNTNLNFKIVGQPPETRHPAVISIRNDWPILVNILNKALSSISVSEQEHIRQRWLGNNENTLPFTVELPLTVAERAWVREHPVIRTRANRFPPYQFWDNGPKGISVELLHKIAEKAGFRVEYVSPEMTWIEALDRVRRRDGLDVLLTAKRTPEREEYLAFSQDYLSLPWVIFTRQNDYSVVSLEDLYGKTVAVERGYALQEKLAKEYSQIRQLLVVDAAEALAMVSKGKADAYIGNLTVAQFHIVNQGVTNLKVAAGTALGEHTQAFAVRKDWPELASIIDKGLMSITPEERNAIQRKYFSVELTERIDYTHLLQIVAVALLIIAMILYWNRRLAIEIAQRKRSEHALYQSQIRYQRLVNDIGPNYVIFSDCADGTIEYLSNGFAHVFGQPVSEAIGQPWHRVAQWDKATTVQSLDIYTKFQAGVMNETELEMNFTHPDGHLRTLSVTIHAVRDAQGKHIYTEGIALDITERQQAEQQLRENEEKLRSLYELSPLGIALTNMQGQFIEFNEAFVKICGYSAEELKNLDYWVLTPREYTEQEALQLESLATIGRYGPYEKHYQRQNGERVPLRLNGVLVQGRDGQFYIWSLVEDISLQKQNEAELIRAREAAESANQAKSAFLANMSHELRTPLNAILGFAQILLNDRSLNETQHRQVQNILHGGEYLLTLINDILDLAKVEAGHFELLPQPWNTQNFFRELSNMFEIRAKQKEITFRYEPVQILPYILYADDKRLRQILINLLGNAIKFTDQGHVILRSGFNKGQLWLEVIDSGIGIAADELDKIFEPFQQTGKARYKIQGTGLGLAITSRLIHLMGGQLSVSSTPGVGSVFHLEIPVEVVSTLIEAKSQQDDRPKVTGYQRLVGDGSFKILIVDDIADNREVLRYLLESLAFMVTEASNGRHCLEIVQTWSPDLIFMDLRMPELDGFETTLQLRTLPAFKNTPIVALSASIFADDYHQSRMVGCNVHLGKPIRLGELLDTLNQLLPLAWNYVTDSESSTATIFPEDLPPELNESFQDLVKCGDIAGLQEFIEQLSALGEYSVLVNKLETLVRSFDLKGLKQLAQCYVKSNS